MKIRTRFLPSRQRLVRKLESKAPARALNIPRIMLLTQQLGYYDKDLPRDLVYGMGIFWGIETTNSLAPRNTPAKTNLRHMTSSIRIRNGPTIKALSNARDRIPQNKRRRLSMGEFRANWISELKPVTNFDRRNAVLSHRFFVPGQHGLQEPKYRLIDDLAKSLANGTVGTTETYCPKGLDAFASITRLE